MKKSGKKIFIIAGKILVGLLLSWVLIDELRESSAEFNRVPLRETLMQPDNLLLLAACILLMPVNWIIETIKWRMIVRTLTGDFSFRKAFKSVFAGVAFGNLAPGRATEFAGKIIFVPQQFRVHASYLHFVSGASQLSITILAGLMAVAFKGIPDKDNTFLTIVTFGFIPVVLGASLLFFFNPRWFFQRLRKIKMIRKRAEGEVSVERKVQFQIFALSAVRYLVFAIQFLLIAGIFFSEKNFSVIVPGVCLYYLFSSVVPMFSVIEPFMRGGIAVIVFGKVEPNSINVFISSTAIWLINIVIPSVAGYLFFLFHRPHHKH